MSYQTPCTLPRDFYMQSHNDKSLEVTEYVFIKKNFFWCGPFLKSLLNLLEYCFCFMFWFSNRKVYGTPAPRPGIEPASFALEGEVLTTGLPGKSLEVTEYV